LSNHSFLTKVRLQILFGHVFCPLRELHKGVYASLALSLASLGLLDDPAVTLLIQRAGGEEKRGAQEKRGA